MVMTYEDAWKQYADARLELSAAAYARLQATVRSVYPTATGVRVEFEDSFGFLTAVKLAEADAVAFDDMPLETQHALDVLNEMIEYVFYEGVNAQLESTEIDFLGG